MLQLRLAGEELSVNGNHILRGDSPKEQSSANDGGPTQVFLKPVPLPRGGITVGSADSRAPCGIKLKLESQWELVLV